MFLTMYLISLITFYLFIGLCCCNIRNNNVNYNNVTIEKYPHVNKINSDDDKSDEDEIDTDSTEEDNGEDNGEDNEEDNGEDNKEDNGEDNEDEYADMPPLISSDGSIVNEDNKDEYTDTPPLISNEDNKEDNENIEHKQQLFSINNKENNYTELVKEIELTNRTYMNLLTK